MKTADLKQPAGKRISKNKLIIIFLAGLAVLIAITFVRFNNLTKKYAERDKSAKAQLTVEANEDFPVIEDALAVYYSTNNSYPKKLSDLGLATDVVKSSMYEGLDTTYRYNLNVLPSPTDPERYCRYLLEAGILIPSWEGQDYYEATRVFKNNC